MNLKEGNIANWATHLRVFGNYKKWQKWAVFTKPVNKTFFSGSLVWPSQNIQHETIHLLATWVSIFTLSKIRNWKKQLLGWRDGSIVKSIFCSYRGLGFGSQQPHGGSQPVNSVPLVHQACLWCTNIHAGKSFIYIIIFKKKQLLIINECALWKNVDVNKIAILIKITPNTF